MPLRAAIFGGLVGLVAAGCAQAQDPQRPAVGGIGSPPDAMIFYVARGADGACGPGCSEWIAAEGTVQWDTHKRLIAILDRQAGRKLPVVIHAWGDSNLNVAASLGRILRDRGIDTTAGPTDVEACNGKTEAECFALKRPGGPLDAKVTLTGRPCDLACVLMLAGGVHRSLPAGTRVILSGMSIRNRVAPNVSEERAQGLTARFGELFRLYLRDMGVEPSWSTSSTGIRKPGARPKCRHPNGSGCTSSRQRRCSAAAFHARLQSSPRSRNSRRIGSGIDGHAGGGGFGQIGRRGVLGQIAPALERAHRPRRDRDHLGLHHQAAAADAVLVAERLDRDDLFAGGDFALDHPIERAAGEEFLVALRRHPRDVDVTKRQALFLGGRHAFGNPALEFLD